MKKGRIRSQRRIRTLPLNNGYGSGRLKNMRIRIPNTVCNRRYGTVPVWLGAPLDQPEGVLGELAQRLNGGQDLIHDEFCKIHL